MKYLIQHLREAAIEVGFAIESAEGHDGFADLTLIRAELNMLLHKAESYYTAQPAKEGGK